VPPDATLDTSFWINAYRVGLIPQVARRFTLHCAPDVQSEVKEWAESGRDFWRRVRSGEIRAATPSALHLQEFSAGERAAISLVIEHPDWFLLLDDYRPFVEATRRVLKAVSTPMLVVTLYRESAISTEEALSMLGGLAAIQTVSPHLIAGSLAPLGRS